MLQHPLPVHADICHVTTSCSRSISLSQCCYRYMEAYNKLAGDEAQRAALSASNAAEAATTMAAVADMLLKLGEVDEAAASLDTSLELLEQFPCQLPALQIKRTELYLTTLQMQIHIFRNDLAGAQQKLQSCIALTGEGAEYRPGFVRRVAACCFCDTCLSSCVLTDSKLLVCCLSCGVLLLIDRVIPVGPHLRGYCT